MCPDDSSGMKHEADAVGVSPVRYCDLPDYRAAYRDTGGDGEVVVFLHALAGSSESWVKQFSAFSAAGYRAIAPDRRGWGDSGLAHNGDNGVGTAAEDLDAFVDALGIGSFHLVGIAGGGFVALDYAEWRADRIRSLVIAASTGRVAEPEIETFIECIKNPDVTWPSIYLELGPSYLGSEPVGVARWERIFEYARRRNAPEQPLRSPNTFRKISRINATALVLSGGADQLAPPALMRLWAAHLPDCHFEVIAAAGHSINWEYPEAFNRIVLDFLGGLQAVPQAREVPIS